MVDSNTERKALAGTFLVLDGPDGAGKTTLQGLLSERFGAMGLNVTRCKDPGGTEIGNRIRSVLLDHDLGAMAVNCETLLFMASRAQLIAEVVRPALNRGHVVLCDRYVSSTCAYQGAIGADVDRIIDLATYATDGMWPDMTVVLDVPVEVGTSRIGRRANVRPRPNSEGNGSTTDGTAAHLDAMERRPLTFHQRVRENFLSLPGYYPSPVQFIDATGTIEEVADRAMEILTTMPRPQLAERSGN
jgi:dTMP kinase